MSIRVTVEPTAEPISTTAAETHGRIDSTDGLTAARIAAARYWLEAFTWRYLVLRTVEERRDAFPACIRPHGAPLRAVESVKYLDTAGALTTLTAVTDYAVYAQGEPGSIEPAYGKSWPSTYAVREAVRVVYRAGYAVPFTASGATITATGHWFADGDPVYVWTTDGDLPLTLTAKTYWARDVVAGATLSLAASSGGAAITTSDAGTGTHFLGRIPEPLLQALQVLVAELAERRENSIVGAAVTPVSLTAQHLAEPYRIRW